MAKNSKQKKREEKKKKADARQRRENIAVFTTLGICIALLLALVIIIIVQNTDFDSDDAETTSSTEAAGETINYQDFVCYKKDGEIGIMSYTGSAERVVIPSEIEGATVKYVWDAFRNNEKVKEVVIPNTVTELDGCFEGCTSLKKVSFHNSVNLILEKTFSGCTSLTTIEFHGSEQQYKLIQLYDGTGTNAPLLSATVDYQPY